jgi:hypothetical protein
LNAPHAGRVVDAIDQGDAIRNHLPVGMMQPARFVGQHVAKRPFAATWPTSALPRASVSASSPVMKAVAEALLRKSTPLVASPIAPWL